MNKPCFNKCINFATKTTPSPSQFLLYGCKLHKKTFGVLSDCEKNMPNRCKEYEKV